MKILFKILTFIFIAVFYLVRFPIVIVKDVILALYSPFDMARFWTTYQNCLANFSVGEECLEKQLKNELLEEQTEEIIQEQTAVGFKVCQTGLETVQSPTEAGIINDKRV